MARGVLGRAPGGVQIWTPPGGSGPQGPKTLEFLAIDLAGFLKCQKRVILGPYPPWAPGGPLGPQGPRIGPK